MPCPRQQIPEGYTCCCIPNAQKQNERQKGVNVNVRSGSRWQRDVRPGLLCLREQLIGLCLGPLERLVFA